MEFIDCETFCKMVWNISYADVLSVIEDRAFKSFDIPKKNGKRRIDALLPECELYRIQKRLSRFINNNIFFPLCAKGFTSGNNYIAYLEPHVGSNYFMRLDIKEFFPSITDDLIRASIPMVFSCRDRIEEDRIADLVLRICIHDGILPQGAPLSPTISNIVMMRLDQRILKYCQASEIKYTRYADDMLFSSDNVNFAEKTIIKRKVGWILNREKFKLNYNKVKYSKGELSLSGYVVAKEGIRLSRKRMRDVQKILRFMKDNESLYKSKGVEEFMKLANKMELERRDLSRCPFTSLFQLVQILCGYRAYFISFLYHDIDYRFEKKIRALIFKIEEQILNYT